ncbi:MAG: FAD-dependent oxidoreductase [Butyricicoccaceae bacterium]
MKLSRFPSRPTIRRDNRAVCHLTCSTAETHEIIRANLDRSPLYGGKIEGVGPRYCPSIEDKVVRFADKPRHQLFLEPMGLDTEEIYVQGFSSSMPFDVQRRMLHSVKGLEHAEIMRPVAPSSTTASIRPSCADARDQEGPPASYGAGQFCGFDPGYEEAAAQGLVAGINAALRLKGGAPCSDRADGYIGTLDRRSGDARHERAVPHDDLALGVPPAAAAGQRGRSALFRIGRPRRTGCRPNARKSTEKVRNSMQKEIRPHRHRSRASRRASS